MNIIERLEKEIDRVKKIIEDCENTMEQVPQHLKPSQEIVLEIYKKELEVLEQQLIKYTNEQKPEIS